MIPSKRMDESSYTNHSSMERGREKVEHFRRLEPQEDVETYFISFETHMTTCSVEKTSWLKHLAPLLDPEASRVYVNLDEDARIKYDEVKKALFQHYWVTLLCTG